MTNEDNLFPIAWEESEFIDIISIIYSNVIFLEDFGEFKKGYQTNYLYADIESGILQETDDDGEIIQEQAFKCIAYN